MGNQCHLLSDSTCHAISCFQGPPQLFLPNPSKVTAATTSHVLSGLLFHLPKPLSTLDKCFKEYFKREKKEHYLHYPEEKLSCLKKNGPTTFKECRMFRHSKLFKSHYGRKPYQQVTLVPNIKYYSSQGSDLLWPRTTSL